jgi:hypothetical protein
VEYDCIDTAYDVFAMVELSWFVCVCGVLCGVAAGEELGPKQQAAHASLDRYEYDTAVAAR